MIQVSTLARCRPWLLTAGLLALCSRPAAAHFVWAEPAPDAPGSVRVCFGEYPTVREGAPLLEKISGVRLHALNADGRRELKAVRKDDHFLFAGAGTAPVAVGVLDYGLLQRGDTPPYLLRYETQLLRGEGKPLSTAELARLSRLKTELPLAVTLQAPAPDRLALHVTLDGRPVQAEIAYRSPRAQEMQETKTSAEGRLELPVTEAGWYHVRVKAEDGKPVTFQGKPGSFTRTYLSLMFQAAGPSASASARTDSDAVQILRDAHAARANWGPDFPGFTAEALYRLNGKELRGTVTVRRDYRVELALGDRDAENTLRPSFASLVMHRRGGSTPEYRATWRDPAPHALGPAINLNDEHGSFYRVRDRQILQVNRVMGSQRFTNNVLENEETKLGFLPRAWTVAYYERDGHTLLRTSTTRVTWAWQGDIFLPATMQVMVAHPEGTDASELVLSNHRLLK